MATYPDLDAWVDVIEWIRSLWAISFSSWIVLDSGLWYVGILHCFFFFASNTESCKTRLSLFCDWIDKRESRYANTCDFRGGWQTTNWLSDCEASSLLTDAILPSEWCDANAAANFCGMRFLEYVHRRTRQGCQIVMKFKHCRSTIRNAQYFYWRLLRDVNIMMCRFFFVFLSGTKLFCENRQ